MEGSITFGVTHRDERQAIPITPSGSVSRHPEPVVLARRCVIQARCAKQYEAWSTDDRSTLERRCDDTGRLAIPTLIGTYDVGTAGQEANQLSTKQLIVRSYGATYG